MKSTSKRRATTTKAKRTATKQAATALGSGIVIPADLLDDVGFVGGRILQIAYALDREKPQRVRELAEEIIAGLRHREWRRAKLREAEREQREAASARELAWKYRRKDKNGVVTLNIMRAAEHHDARARLAIAEAS